MVTVSTRWPPSRARLDGEARAGGSCGDGDTAGHAGTAGTAAQLHHHTACRRGSAKGHCARRRAATPDRGRANRQRLERHARRGVDREGRRARNAPRRGGNRHARGAGDRLRGDREVRAGRACRHSHSAGHSGDIRIAAAEVHHEPARRRRRSEGDRARAAVAAHDAGRVQAQAAQARLRRSAAPTACNARYTFSRPAFGAIVRPL
jgi:hypothetical protein